MTANGSDVSDGDILTGSQVVRVYGQNLTAPFVTLTFGDVEYTPLNQGEGYSEFILGDNGTATINVDGSRFMSFEVEGISVPDRIPCYMTMVQAVNASSGVINQMSGNYSCINYPYMFDETHAYFRLSLTRNVPSWEEADFNDFEGHNCTIQKAATTTPGQMRIAMLVDDVQSVAWLTYQGFIVAVFNYTTH